jgi:hypothetical protein
MVNRFGKKLLAGSARALDQHGAVAFGDVGKNAENLMHLVVLADDVPQRIFLEELFSQLLNRGQIAKRFNASDDLSPRVLQDGSADADGDLFPLFVQDRYREVGDFFFGPEGLFEGAPGLADVSSENVEAEPAEGIPAGEPSDGFGGPVEEGDLALTIRGEDPVGDAVKDDIKKLFGFFTFHHSES